MCLLKFYSLCLLLFFLAEMALAALGFIFPHKISNFLEESLSDELIKSYRDDLDFQNLIDLVQQEFQCCGISSEGYKYVPSKHSTPLMCYNTFQYRRDWSKNEYFNCTTDPKLNPSVERCGVPFSCCLSGGMSEDVGLVNIMCGFEVQDKPISLVITKVRKFISNASRCNKFSSITSAKAHNHKQAPKHFYLQSYSQEFFGAGSYAFALVQHLRNIIHRTITLLSLNQFESNNFCQIRLSHALSYDSITVIMTHSFIINSI